MIRSAIIALTAAATAALAMSPAAQAKNNIDFNIGIGVPLGGIYVGNAGYYDDDYGYDDEDCHYVKVKHKKKKNGKIKVWYTKELVCY